MGNAFFYLFYTFWSLAALWLVIAGMLSFRTKEMTIYVGSKPFPFEGRKAIAAGVLTMILGAAALGHGVQNLYSRYVQNSHQSAG